MNPRCFLLLVAVPVAAASFSVHEWGTFTTVNGSDGGQLPGLEVEEETLPNFVHSLAGFAPANKGWSRPVRGVTVKMETPVVYFYANQPCAVRLEVGFNGGSISQWYPNRTAGEVMSPRPVGLTPAVPVDFSGGYRGGAVWELEVLAPDATDAITASREWETPQWPRARVPGANCVRGPAGEVEGFVFYRGVGHFEPPLRVSCDETGRIKVENIGPARIPFVLIYDQRPGLPVSAILWHGALEPGQSHAEPIPVLSSFRRETTGSIREGVFPSALIAAGLTAAEAKAMLDTWHESYFERHGLRVFWVVPRVFTDQVLPMTITPRPTKVERVLVGRSEVLTREFEVELARGFAADGGRAWAGDRFFRAYAARARQLGVALPPDSP
jgi:hypothetical protein